MLVKPVGLARRFVLEERQDQDGRLWEVYSEI